MRSFPSQAGVIVLIIQCLVSAQVDTIVLSRTNYTFPLTHPGQKFTIEKVIIDSIGVPTNSRITHRNSIRNSNSPVIGIDTPNVQKLNIINKDILGRKQRNVVGRQPDMNVTDKPPNPPQCAATSVAKSSPKAYTTNVFRTRGKWHPLLISNSSLIKSGKDLFNLERAERSAVRQKRGPILDDLSKIISTKNGNDSIEVKVSLKIISPGFLNKMKFSKQERIQNAKLWAHPATMEEKGDIINRFGLKEIDNTTSSRSFNVKTTKSVIMSLSKDPGIAEISQLGENKKAPSVYNIGTPFQNLIDEAYNPADSMTNYGGAGVADVEFGIRADVVNCLDPGLRPVSYSPPDDPGLSSAFYPWHAEEVYDILAKGTPGNYRWDIADYLNGDLTDPVIMDTVEYYGINSINMSEYPGDANIGPPYFPAHGSDTDSYSRGVDQWAYIYPYPTISLPSGDFGMDTIVAWLNYNALIVGNVQDLDYTSTNGYYYNVEIEFDPGGGVVDNYPGADQTGNPPAKYGSVADRETPYLVAPGFTPNPELGFTDSCIGTTDTLPYVDTTAAIAKWGEVAKYDTSIASGSGGGTSYSSPVLAAMATNLIAANQYWLANNPEMVRAALLVTAENVDSGYWDPENHDGRDGAGTVSGSGAIKFISTAAYNPGNTPYESGFDEQYADSTTFFGEDEEPTPISVYQIQTPSTLPSGQHLRVVLTWDSSPGVDSTENEVSNFSIDVTTDSETVYGDSWNGNIQMVDISNSQLTPNSTYPIDIWPWIFRMASDGPSYTYYSIAWTWVNDHAQ